jgi:looped-hinge helix DNA binding domain, AbrB family
MKATGIVRRIDDLGRIVIPKELRRTLRMHEGDPIEIFTDSDGSIILKKYSALNDITHLVDSFTTVLHKQGGVPVVVTGTDGSIVSTAGITADEFASAKTTDYQIISESLKIGVVHLITDNPTGLQSTLAATAAAVIAENVS